MKHKGACHCGTVRFEVALPDGLASAMRCNCSYCEMRGAVALAARQADFQLLAGAENLTLYQFNTGTARHHFCKTCGVYIYHNRRVDPDQVGLNLACLDGVSPFDLPQIPVWNGREHPSDGHASKLAVVTTQTKASP